MRSRRGENTNKASNLGRRRKIEIKRTAKSNQAICGSAAVTVGVSSIEAHFENKPARKTKEQEVKQCNSLSNEKKKKRTNRGNK
jgi:hypothetical protein